MDLGGRRRWQTVTIKIIPSFSAMLVLRQLYFEEMAQVASSHVKQRIWIGFQQRLVAELAAQNKNNLDMRFLDDLRNTKTEKD